MVRYYSVMRPVGIGTYPEGKVIKFENYSEPTYCASIERTAWGYIDYEEELSEEMAKRYELVKKLPLPKKSKLAGSNGTVFHIDNELNKFVSEWCQNCDNEVFMEWDVAESGFRAYCPHCGAELMLCDECKHRDPKADYTSNDWCSEKDCDWNEDGDECCMMQRGIV